MILLKDYIQKLQELEKRYGGEIPVAVRVPDYERLTVSYEDVEPPYPLIGIDGIKWIVVEG